MRRYRSGAGMNWYLIRLLGIVALTAAIPVFAEPSPTGIRVQNAVGKFTRTQSAVVVYPFRTKSVFGSDRIELSIGSLVSDTDEAMMVAIGPVWHFPLASDRSFVELGFAPTLLSDSNFELRDLGGKFHFTTSVSIGCYFGPGRDLGIAIRAQHTSNGGLDRVNPGFDMLGLNISLDF